jgi:hypothetical protein
MNRRRAIYSIALLSSGVAASGSGYEWYSIAKTPDLTFLDNNKAMVADLAEVIIPRTDTCGAKDVMAHETIVTLIKNADRKTQNNFVDGLKAVHVYTNDRYGRLFAQLTFQEQQDVVKRFQEKGWNLSGLLGKAKNKLLGKSFFQILKEQTTIAFCTSQCGATQALAYDFIPHKYNGCMKLAANQRSWATR